MQVVRKTLVASTTTDFEFDISADEFMIKNFTSGDIYVAYDDTFDKDKSVCISSGFGENFTVNEFISRRANLTVKVQADIAGIVEIRATRY